MTPACDPVNERAVWPRLAIAMARRAIEIRSPAVRSMSISRPGGNGLTCWARSSSSYVVSHMAETTTQRGDVLAVRTDTLETGHDRDVAVVQRSPDPPWRDVDDARLAV